MPTQDPSLHNKLFIAMASTTVVPAAYKHDSLDITNNEIAELVRQAQESDAADKSLTVRQALRKYPQAVFWAMFLSTSLIMEGYDLVIVGTSRSTHW